ncbi:hypothetical protein Lal_00000813 [Lupinus albus]|nr:hypothetical protein Lal_00000813 [Lupinus albus]
MDESNKLEHIIWVFGDSIRAYEAFGDVVVFDTTINHHDLPLGLWIEIDNHGNSILCGCENIHKQFLLIKTMHLRKSSQWNHQTQNMHFAYGILCQSSQHGFLSVWVQNMTTSNLSFIVYTI